MIGCNLKRVAWMVGVTASMAVTGGSASAQCGSFSLSQSGGATIDPGTVDVGNHCDDCTTVVTLPFAVRVYGATYTTARVCSNGSLQFTTDNADYTNDCLPRADLLGVAICPHWDDLRTDGAGKGIYSSVQGTAPNRIFNLEWRSDYYSGAGQANFEVRLFEDGTHFEVVFGRLDEGGAYATVGVQDAVLPPTQFECNTAGLISAGTKLTFTCYNGPTGVASAAPNPVYACGTQGTTTLSVNVTPGVSPPSTGITVTADLSSIGGSASQVFYNDGTHGDPTPGDRVWSYQMLVPPITAPGNKTIPYTLADAQGRSTSGVLGLTVNPCPSTGPDVIVQNLTDVNYYGSLGDVSAYSIGTNACNAGDFPVLWIQGGTQHPLIAQNMYRLKNGRFEQLGQSFLKNSFQSLNSPGCGTCVQPPMGGAQLGVGCSDVYGAGYNGGQGNLSRRSQCNATTGVFSWPPPGDPGNVIGQRLQVYTADIDPAQNAGALYFGEAQYVTADDAQWTVGGAPGTNGLNNVSYQRIAVTGTTTAPTISGPPHSMSPAIQAWKDTDPTVSMAVADYVDTSLGTPGIVARFWVAGKATDNGNGTWHYEYAVFNLNSDRCGGSFTVPIGTGVTVTNVEFHGVFAHSGEPYPNTAANPDNWNSTVANGTVRWTPRETYQPPRGDNVNALRWGTMYNFRFDADSAPITGITTVGLFKPGTPASVDSGAMPRPGNRRCRADYNNDGVVSSQDFFDFVAAFFTGNADFNGDGVTNSQDFFDFLGVFFGPC